MNPNKIEDYILNSCNPEINVTYAGEALFNEGDSIDGVYYVLENHIKITKYDQNSERKFLWYANPQEFVGLTSFFHGGGQFTFSGIVEDKPCKTAFIPGEEFRRVIQLQPYLKHNLLKILCARIGFMEMRIKSSLYQSTDNRIIETILFLASRERNLLSAKKQKKLRIKYSAKDFSEMVGTSIEYLRKRIAKLKAQNLIDYGRGWILVFDIERLKLTTRH